MRKEIVDAMDYIDWYVGREDATASAAVNVCQNCRQTCDTLRHVPEFDFMGCGTCFDEAMAEIAKEVA